MTDPTLPMEPKGKLTTLEEVITQTYGVEGAPSRELFEAGYQDFKNEVLAQELKDKTAEKGDSN